jgi:cystathionine beta-lyase/cystathionine gamma-synthase
MKFRTRSIHVGNEPDPQTGAVVPPIYLATTFIQPGVGEWGEFDYSRSGSPTRKNVETTVASLESGNHALLFASGMAATHCVTMLLKQGDHIVANRDLYGGSYRLLHRICDRSGIEVTLVDVTDLQQVQNAFRANTKLLWIETIGNPLMSIPDIKRCAEIAHNHKALLGVDNTFASPVLCRPLELGADIVMHSATKYLGGHSDCLVGALITADEELHKKLYFIQNACGSAVGPLEAYLLGRGIKTLDIRMREQCRSAVKVAEFLKNHSSVERVLYPGLHGHPGHQLAATQFSNLFGTMMSFEIHGDVETTKRVCKSTKLFGLAVSLGAVESLIAHPATMSHASYAPEARAAAGISDRLIRLSVGLEDVEDLIDDLSTALSAI